MKILCPTDFSGHSIKALNYAVKLANKLGAELHVISIFQEDKTSSPFMSMDDMNRKKHETEMRKILVAVGPLLEGDLLPSASILMGETVNEIMRYSAEQEIDLIIMGTQGGNSMRTIFLGSTTRKLAEKTKTPLIAIPNTNKHLIPYNKLLLSLDDAILENESIFKIPIIIAKQHDANIDILHITSKEDLVPFDPFISAYLGDTMGESTIIKGKDIIATIKKYAEEQNVSMLMMIRREKSFLQKLLIVGNTSAELASTNIPLMILPE